MMFVDNQRYYVNEKNNLRIIIVLLPIVKLYVFKNNRGPVILCDNIVLDILFCMYNV